MALPFLLHPAVPLLQWHRTELGVEPGDDIPIDLRHGSEEKALSYSASEALTKLTTLRGELAGHDLMSISMMHGATRLADLIDIGGHRQGDEPILEFARHFRNKEPKHPSVCRDLVLSATLHGQRATWNTISPRRYVEFLDDISNYFVPGAIPPPS